MGWPARTDVTGDNVHKFAFNNDKIITNTLILDTEKPTAEG